MNAIPEEDDITRRQLWKRIDEVFPVIANVTDQLQPQITSIKEIAMADVRQEIGSIQQRLDNHRSEIDSLLGAYTKKLNETIYTALKNLSEENAKNVKVLEEKIRDVQFSIAGIVNKQTADTLSPVVTRMVNISKDVEAFKKDVSQSIGKFQTENVGKVSLLNKKLDDALGKLRKLTSSF